MGRILSQDEIDALLGSSPSSEATSRVPGGHDAVVTYDFRRPDRASREQIRSLHLLHDRFARNVSTSLSAYLRTVTEVDHRLGGAVHVLRVPDVAAGPDGVLRALAAADGGHRRHSSSTRRSRSR